MIPSSFVRTSLLAVACIAVTGCSSVGGLTRGIANVVTPYKVEVVQGNFISREQVEQLQPGMSRQQVRDVLGTPLVTSVFHADRWDYVFTLKRQGVEPQARRLTVYFNGDAMARAEGDTMPSETEFVTAINKQRPGKVPPLEASAEQLRKAAPVAQAATPQQAAPPPAATTYPPLEPVVR